MTPAIPTSADQGALPPGLAEASAAHLEPGEALIWAGRGTRAATFLGLAPGMALVMLVLGLFAYGFLTIEGWEFRGGGRLPGNDMSPDTVARGVGIFIGATLIYYLLLFVRRVGGAGRDTVFLTDRRLIADGWSVRSIPHDEVRLAEIGSHWWGPSLSFVLRGRRGKAGARPALFGLANADAALSALDALGFAVEDSRRPSDEGDCPPPLAVGEAVRWSGRRGWHALDSTRLIMIGLAIPLLIPFLLALRWVLSLALGAESRMGLVVQAGGMLILACLFVGPMAWFVLSRAPHFLDDLIVDMFGTLAVTDRRILFVGPLGTIDREIPAERLISADLVEAGRAGRGHIALTLAGNRDGDLDIVELPGVPDAEAAAAAMSRLVRR